MLCETNYKKSSELLNYGPFESGLALLPMTVMIMVLMISTAPRLMSRFGIKRNLVTGLGLLAAGIAMFSLTPSDSSENNTTYVLMLYVLPASPSRFSSSKNFKGIH
jgi:fucose permease